ncbi:MAG: tripartite tricarboxylate transporter family receptor [Clostridiales bacterium]|nr:tripartite tricarboxylate transporter family receptor [Clostridiales bacterium]
MNNAGAWAGIVTFAYSLVMFIMSLFMDYYTEYGPAPGFFPRWLSGLLTILSLFYIWESVKKDKILTSELFPKDKKALYGIASTVGGLLLFAAATPLLGFIIPCSLFLFIMLIRDYKWYTAIIASVIVSLLLMFVFQSLLGVALPVNDFGF